MPHRVRAALIVSVFVVTSGCVHDGAPIVARVQAPMSSPSPVRDGPPLEVQFRVLRGFEDESIALPAMMIEVRDRRSSTRHMCATSSTIFECALTLPRASTYDVLVVDAAHAHEAAPAFLRVPKDTELVSDDAILDERTATEVAYEGLPRGRLHQT